MSINEKEAKTVINLSNAGCCLQIRRTIYRNQRRFKVFLEMFRAEVIQVKVGIEFEISNNFGKYINDILAPIDITKYKWKLDWIEMYIKENRDIKDHTIENLKEFNIPDCEVVQGRELERILNIEAYYIIFCGLQAFHDSLPVEINTYSEYLNSDCTFCLTIDDCTNVILLCKDVDLLERLSDNAMRNDFKNIEYILEDDPHSKRVAIP